MPITVRNRQYTPTAGLSDGEIEPEVDVTPAPAARDIPKNTRVALAHYMSDLSLGRGTSKASVRGVTDEAIVETTLRSQPIVVKNDSFSQRVPKSTSGAESLVMLSGDTLQRAPGSTSAYVSQLTSINSGSAKVDDARLFNVGAAIAAEAAGDPSATQQGFDPRRMSAFSVEQLFSVRRAVTQSSAIDVLRRVAATGVATTSPTEVTWGQVSSPASPYDSITSAAAITIAAGVISAVSLALSAAAATARAAAAAAAPTALETSGRRPLGTSASTSQLSSIARFVGIPNTKNAFSLCIAAGVSAFFGVQTSRAFLSAFTNIVGGDAGFKLTIARFIIRSAASAASATPNDVTSADISSLITRGRQLVSIVSAFATLGDLALSAAAGDDARVSFPAASAPPTSYLIPDTLSRELSRVPGLGFTSPISSTKSVIVSSVDRRSRGARISTDDRESIERQLNAEYVPFYFHDLRTNEIVAFNAFLSHLQDSFSPQWESSEGFGRVDAVQTYKSTSRSIALDFIAVATSPADFDEMWLKINKLVTLVYPQFDGGRWVQSDASGTDRFVQPFSQTFAASPLIRLRVGDVITSNYSKFALQRVFGYGEDGLKFGGSQVNYASAIDPGALSSLVRSTATQPGSGYTFYVAPGVYAAAPLKSPSAAAVFDTTVLSSQRTFVVTVLSSIGDAAVICSISQSTEQSDVSQVDVTKYGQRYAGGSYVIEVSALRPTQATLRSIEKRVSGQPAGGSAEVDAFFADDSNAIVKSFREAGGVGLAGKIDSLSINMLDKAMWETDVNRRAPMSVTISMVFSVIHDIAPGLDRFGFSRAPTYSAGRSG